MSQDDQNDRAARLFVDVMTEDDLLDLIVKLDARIGKWDFTLKLVEHFDGLRSVHAIERQIHDRPARTVGTHLVADDLELS